MTSPSSYVRDVAGMLFIAVSFVGLPAESLAAAEVQVRGKVVRVEGHINPACRRVFLKRADTGAVMTFRVPDTGTDQSIVSVALTAAATGNDMEIDYDPLVTTGCGTEPKIIYNTALFGS